MSSSLLTAADLLMERLEAHGVSVVFGYPGGQLTPLYDALSRRRAIRHIRLHRGRGRVHGCSDDTVSVCLQGGEAACVGVPRRHRPVVDVDRVQHLVAMLRLTGLHRAHHRKGGALHVVRGGPVSDQALEPIEPWMLRT